METETGLRFVLEWVALGVRKFRVQSLKLRFGFRASNFRRSLRFVRIVLKSARDLTSKLETLNFKLTRNADGGP